MNKVDLICLDSNAFIDLVSEHREQAHRLLSRISEIPAKTRRIVIHLEQIKEIIYVLTHKIIPNLPDKIENKINLFQEANALAEYFRNVEHLARTSPEELENLGLIVGDPAGNLNGTGTQAEINRWALEAKNTLGPSIQALSRRFIHERTDAIIVALAKRLKTSLLSSDTEHIAPMCALIKDQEDNGLPPWRNYGDRGWPKHISYRSSPLKPVKKKMTARQRMESLAL